MKERVQKILAKAGLASRRAAEKYIRDGRVFVNGQPVKLGDSADAATDTIEVEGLGKLSPEPLTYIALHKPPMVMSTLNDPEGRPTVIEVIEKSRATGKRRFEGQMPRVFPVGRLDFDAEGLILMTNDGALANLVTHPRHHVPKTYMVKVRGIPDEKALERLRKGVRLKNADGTLSRVTGPADVALVKQGNTNSWIELTVFEGRYHQVKRMCEAIGHFTTRLIRIDFGGISLEPLPPGAWRFLTQAEVEKLKAWGSGNAGEGSKRRREGSGSAGPERGGPGGRRGAPQRSEKRK